MSPNTTSTDMNDMPLPTVYFASNRSKDADMNIESCVDVDFANSIDDEHSISDMYLCWRVGQLAGSRGLKRRSH